MPRVSSSGTRGGYGQRLQAWQWLSRISTPSVARSVAVLTVAFRCGRLVRDDPVRRGRIHLVRAINRFLSTVALCSLQWVK